MSLNVMDLFQLSATNVSLVMDFAWEQAARFYF